MACIGQGSACENHAPTSAPPLLGAHAPRRARQAYIDFEISEAERARTRALYERLLNRTRHVKVWMSYAAFEAAPLAAPELDGGADGAADAHGGGAAENGGGGGAANGAAAARGDAEGEEAPAQREARARRRAPWLGPGQGFVVCTGASVLCAAA